MSHDERCQTSSERKSLTGETGSQCETFRLSSEKLLCILQIPSQSSPSKRRLLCPKDSSPDSASLCWVCLPRHSPTLTRCVRPSVSSSLWATLADLPLCVPIAQLAGKEGQHISKGEQTKERMSDRPKRRAERRKENTKRVGVFETLGRKQTPTSIQTEMDRP